MVSLVLRQPRRRIFEPIPAVWPKEERRVSATPLLFPQDIQYLVARELFHSATGMPTGFRARRGSCGGTRSEMERRLAELVSLASVSRTWRAAVVPFLYGAVVCEQTEDGWRTNMGLFTTELSRWARQVVVLQVRGLPADAAGLLGQLRGGGFAAMAWGQLSAVQFLTLGEHESFHIQHKHYQQRRQAQLEWNEKSLFGLRSIPPLAPEGPKVLHRDVCAFVAGCLLQGSHGDEMKTLHAGVTQSSVIEQLEELRVRSGRIDLLPIVRRLRRLSEAERRCAVVRPAAQPCLSSIGLSLTQVSLDFSGPRVLSFVQAVSSSLRSLHLEEIPAGHVADVLQLGSQQHQFPQLRSINLRFQDSPAEQLPVAPGLRFPDFPAQQLPVAGGLRVEPAARAFPRMRSVELHDLPWGVHSALRAFVHNNTENVVLLTSGRRAGSLLALDVARQMPGARSVEVSVLGIDQIATDTAQQLASRVLETSVESAQLRRLRLVVATYHPLTLSDAALRGAPCNIEDLELRIPVSMPQMADLIGRMPRLWRLAAPYICAKTLPAGEVESLDELFELQNQAAAKPISRSLQVAHVGFSSHHQPVRSLVCHALHMALRLPNLMELDSDAHFKAVLENAIRGLSMIHEHQFRWSHFAPFPKTPKLPPPPHWLRRLRSVLITTEAM
ncbi:hypothetical protein GGF46_002120 [Coemansia sp. RSA 552]|nr:hypothetical protein GGF46_002120 [Coemansia sp. RSA 552]